MKKRCWLQRSKRFAYREIQGKGDHSAVLPSVSIADADAGKKTLQALKAEYRCLKGREQWFTCGNVVKRTCSLIYWAVIPHFLPSMSVADTDGRMV